MSEDSKLVVLDEPCFAYTSVGHCPANRVTFDLDVSKTIEIEIKIDGRYCMFHALHRFRDPLGRFTPVPERRGVLENNRKGTAWLNDYKVRFKA